MRECWQTLTELPQWGRSSEVSWNKNPRGKVLEWIHTGRIKDQANGFRGKLVSSFVSNFHAHRGIKERECVVCRQRNGLSGKFAFFRPVKCHARRVSKEGPDPVGRCELGHVCMHVVVPRWQICT